MADAAWVAELSKAENDTLRQTGDIRGIIAKYTEPTGPRTWSDAPLGEFVSVVGDTWIPGLTTPQRNALFDTHMDVNGNVTISLQATRDALAPLLSAQQIADFTAQFSTQAPLYETLGLTNVGRSGIMEALKEISDSDISVRIQKEALVTSIRAKAKDIYSTSVANLTTIDSIIGT